jgi:hypothetical protein
MGSGLSLNKDQVIEIIKRDLYNELYKSQNSRPRFTKCGYEIFYDYSDEVSLKEIVLTIEKYRKLPF